VTRHIQNDCADIILIAAFVAPTSPHELKHQPLALDQYVAQLLLKEWLT
jgi:hypothetical protein